MCNWAYLIQCAKQWMKWKMYFFLVEFVSHNSFWMLFSTEFLLNVFMFSYLPLRILILMPIIVNLFDSFDSRTDKKNLWYFSDTFIFGIPLITFRVRKQKSIYVQWDNVREETSKKSNIPKIVLSLFLRLIHKVQKVANYPIVVYYGNYHYSSIAKKLIYNFN